MVDKRMSVAAGVAGTAIGGPVLGVVVELFMEYGFEETVKLLGGWLNKESREPTPDEIRAFVAGIRPPEEY